jgi:ParB-like chromosome segregation protein Spo0J
MPIAEGIAAAKGALDVSKLAIDLLRRPKVDPEEVRNKLIEMQDLVFSAQRALGEAEEENRQLKRAVDDLQQQQRLGKDLQFAENAYFRRNEQGMGGPFCPVCWDDAKKLVRLISHWEREWASAPGRTIRFDCVVHGLAVYLRPGIFKPTTVG